MDWRRHLAKQLDDIGVNTRGRYLPEPDAREEQVPGERLLDAGYLAESISRARPPEAATGANPRDDDPRINVTRMVRQYCASLACVALAGLANGVGFDLSPRRCTVIFRNNLPNLLALDTRAEDVLRCAERPTTWPVSGPVVATMAELREYVWTRLYARNLHLLFSTAAGMVRVPRRLLWTNAAEWVAVVMDSAIEYLEPALAEPFVTECRALLDAEFLPGMAGEPNPLRGLLEWLPFDDDEPRHGIQTRHLCCLVYLHSDRHGRLCSNCPLLPLPDRAALIRERRGVGITKLGPAELRCMEIGLSRRRF